MPSSNARRESPQARGDVDAADLDAVHHLVEAATRLPAEDLRRGRLVAVEDELGRVDALVAHLFDLPRHREAGCGLTEAGLLLDEEGRHVLVDRLRAGVGLDEDRDEGGAAAVGEPHLLTVDRPRVTLARNGLRLDPGDIGAAARLAHAERAADLAGRHARQVLLLLLFGAVLQEHVGDDEVGVDDARHAHPAAGDLLDAQRVGEQGLPQAAVLLGDHQAEDPHVLHALDDLRRVLVRVLELRRDRQDLLLDELPDELDELALLLGQTLGALQSRHDATLRCVVNMASAQYAEHQIGIGVWPENSVARRGRGPDPGGERPIPEVLDRRFRHDSWRCDMSTTRPGLSTQCRPTRTHQEFTREQHDRSRVFLRFPA